MSSVTPDEAAKRISVFALSMESDAAAEAFGKAWLAEAHALAATAPSPQARMAASGLTIQGKQLIGAANAIVQRSSSPGSVALGDILFGSEFGSSVYTQFAARTSTGYWLFRSADSPTAMAAFEVEFVDKAIDVATR